MIHTFSLSIDDASETEHVRIGKETMEMIVQCCFHTSSEDVCSK